MRVRFCWIVLVLASSAAAKVNPSNLMANAPGRTTVNLNGAWNVIVDPFENGVGSGFFKDEKPRSNTDRVEYSFDLSPVLNVPGDWNTQREHLMFYEGPVWYRREFSYHKKAGTRVFLHFGAANCRAVAYLNGEKVGEHEGGFTPFEFEVTALLRDGGNFLIVEVNNSRRADGIPASRFDWWSYGGLTRDVALIEVPETFIQDYWVQLAHSSQTEIAGWVQLNGTQPSQVTLEIPEAHVRQTLRPDSDGRVNFRASAKVELWSPEHPKLYDVILTSGHDTVRDQIGFRTIEVQGAKILLNGKPIFLRGISMHEEAPFRDGRAFSAEDAQTLLGWVKELGCNWRVARRTRLPGGCS